MKHGTIALPRLMLLLALLLTPWVSQAEQKVQQLMENNGELRTEPFDGASE